MSNTCTAQKASDTTLNDEKYDVHCSEGAWDMTSVLVMMLGDQPEAFTLDLRSSVRTSHVIC